MPARPLPFIFVALVTAGAVAACGAGDSAARRGPPQEVVRAAPDLTFSAGSARVEASAPDATSRARVRLDGPPTTLVPAGPGAAGYPELARPLALVDMVRGAVGVVSYGGVAVRGASTFRYETVVNVERAVRATPPARREQVEELARALGADAFYADVWVDGRGRVRRVQVPAAKTTQRPSDRDQGVPRLVTVDLYDFEPPP